MSLLSKSVDDMADTKDLLDNPRSEAYANAIVAAIKRDFNPTHVGISVPMNTNAEAIAERSGNDFAIEPAAYAQRFTDPIHQNGMNVLHRGTDCYFEGIYDFPKWVGGNRYPAGTAMDVLGTVFTDDFNRASIGANYTEVGGWTISSGKLQNGGGGWANSCLTNITYGDFTAVGKIQAGQWNRSLHFRSTTSAGYSVQIRYGDGLLRLERWGVENLAEVSKSFTNNIWYKVKVNCVGTAIKCKVWEDGTNEPGTWDIEITNAAYSSGKIGYASEEEGKQFDDLTITPIANYNSWLGRVYNYITNNTALFANGDQWAPFPEATGHGIFNDNTSFLPHSGDGIQTNFANFFIDLKTVSDAAFAVIGKSVTTMPSQNWSELNSGWIPTSLHTAYGMLFVDHYGTQEEGHTATQMKADLRAIKNSYGYPVYLQEWGDYWSTDSQYGFNRNQAQHEAYLDTMYAGFQELINEGTLNRFQYWRVTGGHEAVMTDQGALNFQMNYAGQKLKTFLDNNSITSSVTGIGTITGLQSITI